MVRIIQLVLISFYLVTFSGFSQEIWLKEVMARSKAYDNQQVEIRAEVLDILIQKKGRWFNVLDKDTGIGVWVEQGVFLPAIKYVGAYNTEGDIIKVKGVFHAACPEHLGERDIHAQEVFVINKGREEKEEVIKTKVKLVWVWFISFLVIFVVYLIKGFLTKHKKLVV
jgi:hypothetical protein